MREDGLPQGHVGVQDFNSTAKSRTVMTRQRAQYFVDGKPITLRRGLLWVAKMEAECDGAHANQQELAKFLRACARLMQ